MTNRMSVLKSRALDLSSRLLLIPLARKAGRRKSTPGGHEAELAKSPDSSESQGAGGSNLPVELLLQIFDHISARDIVRFRAVCRAFCQVIDYAPEMQYKIELYVSHNQDNLANTSMGASAKLEALRAYSRRWESLHNWTWESTKLDWDSRLPETSHFCGNLWIQCMSMVTITLGAAPPDDFIPTCDIKLVSFEGTADGKPIMDSWAFKFPYLADDCIADLSRNILCLIGKETADGRQLYRFRTLALTDGLILNDQTFQTTQDDSRLSRHPTYLHRVPGGSLVVYVSSYSKGARSSKADLEIGFIDIESGRAMNVICKTVPHRFQVQFINNEIFLLHVMVGGKFATDVYTIPHVPTEDTRHLATFKYPAVRAAWMEANGGHASTFTCAEANAEPGAWHARRGSPPPFRPCSDVLMVVIYRNLRGTAQLLHCIPTSVFTSVVARLAALDPSAEPLVMSWKSWGPAHTRCFIDTNRWPNYCTPVMHGHQVLKRDLSLLDFNQRDIARSLQRIEATSAEVGSASSAGGRGNPHFAGDHEDVDIPGTNMRIIRTPTVIPRGEMFDKDIVTSLPYKTTQIDWDWNFPNPTCLYGGDTWVAVTRDDGPIYAFTYHVLRKKTEQRPEDIAHE